MRFLHLEDSPSDAELLHELVRDRWPLSTFTTVSTAKDFEQAIQGKDFDLILSDHSLPGYDGLSALAFARAHCPEKPFIYISGTIGEERAIEALKAGAADYVIKDRPGRLIYAVDTALSQVAAAESRRSAEERIEEQAALLDKAGEAISVIDAEGRLTYWNARAERLYGWSASEAVGRRLRDLLYTDDEGRFDHAYALVLNHEEWIGELRPKQRSGESAFIESFWSLVTDKSGLAKSILIIDADIREKKKIEGQLRESQRLETLGMLAGGIAHDLNNVLAPILTAIGGLCERATNPSDRYMLETVEVSARHGADMVRQLLAFARGSGSQRDQVLVDGLIGSVRRLLEPAMPAGIQVRCAYASELWCVQADATQLRQVLVNLCINARDAMPNGGVIEISAEDVQVGGSFSCVQGEAVPGSYVRLSVADTGTGIPPEVVGKIFDPFFTTKESGKGTGLGLVNVAEIVKAHGGFLDLVSRPGAGTTFHIYLPALRRSASDRSEEATARPSAYGQGEHLLVIEDDEGIRTVLEIILSTRGYRVTVAEDGPQGLQLLRQQPNEFALVMTDMNMPGMDGKEVVKAIEAMRNHPKIVVLSGLPSDGDHVPQALANVTILSKPISTETLLESVRRVLDGNSAPHAQLKAA